MEIKGDGASCRVWLDHAPPYKNYKTATVGAFQADDATAGQRILEKALREAKNHGADYVIGPMDGNSWQSYRFVTGDGSSPSFFLEPSNPDFYPDVFRQSGFSPIAEYRSSIAALNGVYGTKVLPDNIRLRLFDMKDIEAELKKIYDLTLKSFAQNFLYTPIDQNDFMALYQPIIPYLKPEYILMAEDMKGQLQGFLFSIPDYAQGDRPNQLIIKTYASLQPGLGGYMADHIHAKAQQDGFKSMIHALMHDGNVSRKNSEKYGEVFRRYTLYGRKV